jgi:hypothetical protein
MRVYIIGNDGIMLCREAPPPPRRPRSMELITRFAWFRRKQQLHFVHHMHGNSNFAIIDNFWDRLLGYLPKS